MSVADTVRLDEQQDVSVAWIAARRGVDAAIIGAAIGMPMPPARRWSVGAAMVMMANGPGIWLAQREGAPHHWCRDLESRLAGLAGISDQTGAYRIFRLEGPAARPLLQRGINLDLDDTAFPAGSVAVTAIAHLDVILRCLATDTAYELAVYRSSAESFLRWHDAALNAA